MIGTSGFYTLEGVDRASSLGTRRCCGIESESMTLIQRLNNVVCSVRIQRG